MANAFTRKALLVAEGTGGHFIPAIEVSLQLLKQGTAVTLWYAKRPKSQALSEALVEPAKQAGVNVEAVPVGAAQGLGRLRLARLLWNQAQQHFDSSAPDVVVGFGGWITMPVVLAARCRGIRCVLHEGNVTMGRANRWLAPWVNDIALSFQSPKHRCRSKKMVVTGFPIRSSIGELKEKPSSEFGKLSAQRSTLLIIGGSQGSRAINRLMMEVVEHLSPVERLEWQILHIAGAADSSSVQSTYDRCGITAWVVPHLTEMDRGYAQADVVIARAGASTLAELSRCGKPAILIPYPHAAKHQGHNARLAESVGGALVIEEGKETVTQLLMGIRRLMKDERLRTLMGSGIRALNPGKDNATARLSGLILNGSRLEALG